MRYSNDPYWTTAKFDSIAADGTTVKKGTRIFYYPNDRKIFVGAAAEAASRDFESCAQDEAFMTGNY